jgi:hypothetical protein
MVVGLSQVEHPFTQWMNRLISPSRSSHRIKQHFLVSNDFSEVRRWAPAVTPGLENDGPVTSNTNSLSKRYQYGGAASANLELKKSGNDHNISGCSLS